VSALDLLVDGFPHGTKAGYDQGCKGAMCPAVIQCRDARRRYLSDMDYRRMVDAGATAEEVLAADAASRERDKDEARASARAEREAQRPPKPAREPKARRAAGQRVEWQHGTENGYRRRGCRSDEQCPSTPSCRAVHAEAQRRRNAANQKPVVAHGTLAGYNAGCFKVDCPATPSCADVNLAHHGHIVLPTVKPVREPRPPVTRRGTKWDHIEKQPHGTNASHARGCKTAEECPNFGTGEPTCLDAHKQYMREYRAARRAEPIPADKHGSRYGYALGCRAGAPCPVTPSCADVEGAADMKRRRARGVPPAAPTVPSEPVRAHVRSLMDRGLAVATIAERAEVSLSGVKTLLYGRSGRRKGYLPRSIKAETARRLTGLSA
jgi:hypothetical protein